MMDVYGGGNSRGTSGGANNRWAVEALVGVRVPAVRKGLSCW